MSRFSAPTSLALSFMAGPALHPGRGREEESGISPPQACCHYHPPIHCGCKHTILPPLAKLGWESDHPFPSPCSVLAWSFMGTCQEGALCYPLPSLICPCTSCPPCKGDICGDWGSGGHVASGTERSWAGPVSIAASGDLLWEIGGWARRTFGLFLLPNVSGTHCSSVWISQNSMAGNVPLVSCAPLSLEVWTVPLQGLRRHNSCFQLRGLCLCILWHTFV